jgi:hypothetical protein
VLLGISMRTGLASVRRDDGQIVEASSDQLSPPAEQPLS